jgi:hypothetical protein
MEDMAFKIVKVVGTHDEFDRAGGEFPDLPCGV